MMGRAAGKVRYPDMITNNYMDYFLLSKLSRTLGQLNERSIK